jgi:thiol-disulfide isomerase/thioredoxin
MSAIKSSSLSKTSFLVFYSSIVDGKMWCPDCVDVEPSVREAFDSNDKPEAMLFYVGKKEEWRTPENVARVDWNVRGIPTIIKLQEGKEIARVTETEILDSGKWQAFLKN